LLAIGSAVVLPPVFLGRELNQSWTAMLPGLVTVFALAVLLDAHRGRWGELAGDLLTVRSWIGSRTIDLCALKLRAVLEGGHSIRRLRLLLDR
jgi:hypothetical protein